MNSTFFNLLLITGVIQGFVFNAVTLFYNKKFEKVIVFLNLVVLFISLNNLQAWLIENGFSSNVFFVKQMLVPWYSLVFPMFYFFLINYLKINSQLKALLKYSILLFIFELLIRIILIIYVYYYIPNQDDILIKNYTAIEEILNAAVGFFIVIKSSYLVFVEKEKYKFIQSYDDIKWIKVFLILGGLILLFWVFAIIINNIYSNDIAYYPLRLSTSILIYWIGYQGFYRYNIVKDRILLRRSITSNNATPIVAISFNSKSDTSAYNSEKHKNDFNQIHDYLISKQKFLDPNLSMDLLAQELRMSSSHFSKIVNSYSDYNFSDYINSFRVEQAKKLLANDDFDKYTNVAIGLECGFNSKSTFYSAFKKFTSQTPTQFRNSS